MWRVWIWIRRTYYRLRWWAEDMGYRLRGKIPRGTYHCPECGSTRVQGTAWIELNSDKLMGGDPPDDDHFCPDCDLAGEDGHIGKHLCCNDGNGVCQWCKESIPVFKEVNDNEAVHSGQGA